MKSKNSKGKSGADAYKKAKALAGGGKATNALMAVNAASKTLDAVNPQDTEMKYGSNEYFDKMNNASQGFNAATSALSAVPGVGGAIGTGLSSYKSIANLIDPKDAYGVSKKGAFSQIVGQYFRPAETVQSIVRDFKNKDVSLRTAAKLFVGGGRLINDENAIERAKLKQQYEQNQNQSDYDTQKTIGNAMTNMNVSDAIANRNAGVTGYKTMYNPNPTLKQAELDMPELSGYGKWFEKKGYAKGGEIKGKGTAKSDSIKAKVEEGAFVVPAENAEKAKAIKEELLESPADEKAELEHKNGVSVKLSDGEYMFTKEEAEELKNMGIDLYKEFAPNSDDLKGLKDGGLTSEKAKIILREGVANGKSLTPAQTRFMGWVAGGRKAKGGIVGYKEGGEVKEYANGGESTSGNEPDLGNNKFESIRKQAEDDLKKKYPNKKVEVVYKGDYRSFDDQNKSFKSGASTTKSSLHQVGGARDFNIIIDGRVLGNSPSDLKIYKDYVWKAAENNGAYHLKEDGFGSTDPYHISLVEEKGDGTAFKRLIENYPALADTDNFKQAIKFAEEQKSKNPKDTTYDGLLAAKEFVASKAAQTNDDFDASFAANVQKANTNLVKVNNSTTDVKTKSTTNTQSSGNKSFDKTINDLLKKDYKEVSDVDKSIAQLNELQAKNKAMGLPYNTSIQNAVQQLNIIKPKIERAATHAKVMGEKTDDIETMAANLKKMGATDAEINAFKTASYKNPYGSNEIGKRYDKIASSVASRKTAAAGADARNELSTEAKSFYRQRQIDATKQLELAKLNPQDYTAEQIAQFKSDADKANLMQSNIDEAVKNGGLQLKAVRDAYYQDRGVKPSVPTSQNNTSTTGTPYVPIGVVANNSTSKKGVNYFNPEQIDLTAPVAKTPTPVVTNPKPTVNPYKAKPAISANTTPLGQPKVDYTTIETPDVNMGTADWVNRDGEVTPPETIAAVS